MPDARTTVLNAISTILARRDGDWAHAIALDSDLFDDLELDSLEVLELSGVLEDDLGRDPFSEGITPRTVGDVIAFYET